MNRFVILANAPSGRSDHPDGSYPRYSHRLSPKQDRLKHIKEVK